MANETPAPMLCGIIQAAEFLSVGRSTVYELLNQGKLESVSIGRRRLVRVDSLRALARGEAA